MTERRVVYMDDNYHYPEEQDLTSDTFTLFGLTIGAGNLDVNGNRITQVPDVPSDGQDAVNQNYVDSVATGLQWREPVTVHNLIGNATVATLNGLGASAGAAYVVTDAGTLTRGSVAVAAGDLVQDDGSNWVLVVTNSGGFVPSGTRATLSTSTALISPYTDGSDDGKIVDFDGASNTGSDTSEATDGSAFIVNGDGGYYENNGYVFDGTVPTGTWIQFTGAGQINAGAGLTKDGNTIDVGNGDGIKVNADSIEVELSSSNPGLELVGTSPNKTLQALAGGANGIVIGATGIEVEIDDSPDTLDVDADGLKVVGLPSLFKVNDVAVGATVTAANLDDLTDGSNADALHTHAGSAATEAPKVEDTHTCNTAVTTGRAVCWSSTAEEIEHADNGADLTAQAIGVARVGAGAGSDAEVVKHGICDGLSGLTVQTAYYLGGSGQLVVAGSIPRPGRVVRMGYAPAATKLDVQIMDFGRRAA